MYVSIFFYMLPTESRTVAKARCVVRLTNKDRIQTLLDLPKIESRLSIGYSQSDTPLPLEQSL